MTPSSVRAQIEDSLSRLILTSLAVRQFPPSTRTVQGGFTKIGRPKSSALALKDVNYEDVYEDLVSNEAYDVRMVDGGLIIFQYKFDGADVLIRHRLAYFPSPILPTIDEAPALYEEEELYGDIIARRLVRFPIRFDYVPSDHVDGLHPASHLTLGQYEGCRIPVAGPLGPSAFVNFIVRNFYSRAYMRHKNKFDKNPPALPRVETISGLERRMCHFVHSR
jgi:hypothetical protein